MAEHANITRRAVLSGVAALPLTPLAAFASPAPTVPPHLEVAIKAYQAACETHSATYEKWRLSYQLSGCAEYEAYHAARDAEDEARMDLLALVLEMDI